jgi:hypothetical protein
MILHDARASDILGHSDDSMTGIIRDSVSFLFIVRCGIVTILTLVEPYNQCQVSLRPNQLVE